MSGLLIVGYVRRPGASAFMGVAEFAHKKWVSCRKVPLLASGQPERGPSRYNMTISESLLLIMISIWSSIMSILPVWKGSFPIPTPTANLVSEEPLAPV